MKKKALLIFLTLILFSDISYSQGTFFKNYDGIPIIANLWGNEHIFEAGYNFNDIQEAGIDAVVSAKITAPIYNRLKQKAKIIPYQCFPTGRFGTVFYSERGYTLWEAEDDDKSHLTLEQSNVVFRQEPNPNGGENISYVRSNTVSSATIIYGPAHYNQLRESIINGNIIPYTAEFRLKLVNKADSSNTNSCNQNIPICKLQVTTEKDSNISVLKEQILFDTDFQNLNNWVTFSLTYNRVQEDSPGIASFERKLLGDVRHWEIIPNVEFKVIWFGSSTLNLCVDNIELSDSYGKKLIENDNVTLNNIMSEVNYQIDPFMSDEDVVGWYPVDEPNYIDNMACVKKVAEVVESQKPNNDIIPSIAGSQTGLLDFGSNYSKINEFYERANYQGAKINTYIFNYPFLYNEPDYIKANIRYLINHLSMANKKDTAFISSIQTGKWDAENTGTLDQTPTRSQFLYNINTALMYGAKGIEMSNYYSFFGDDQRTALIMANRSGDTNTIVKSDLWHVLKDEVSPRLHGNYGKLLKKLKQREQGFLDCVSQSKILGNVNFYRFSSNYEYDCGIFNDIDEKKYFMAVSRWYNGPATEQNPFRLSFDVNNLTEKNYLITEHYSSEVSYNYTTNKILTVDKVILPGEACLYEVKPALRYGGKILVSDTVKTNRELIGNLEVLSNKTLSIIDSCTYTISAELFAKNGSIIRTDHKGNIVFSGTGKYKHETWGNSLFYTSDNGHPKLIWGALQGNQTYGVYRKLGATYLLIATIYSTDNNIKQTYIDSSITIYNGQLAGSEVYYKISRIAGGRTYYTNEISVHIKNLALEKENIMIKDFAIEQNYPNPFNGMTSIKYMIPENGIVKIKIFDILGKEIKVFNEGEKETGIYEFKFNSAELASGIYIYSIQYNNKVLSKKMLLMK